MIIYKNTADGFMNSVNDNTIIQDIENEFISSLHKKIGEGEKSAINNSMRFVESLIRTSKVEGDCGVLVEYNIPTTKFRVDFIIAGQDTNGQKNIIIIELKQWTRAGRSDSHFLVNTFVGGSNREVLHPSYQAYSYQRYLSDLNEEIYSDRVNAFSCSYLHNYNPIINEPLLEKKFDTLLRETPCYFSNNVNELRDFLNKYVSKGKGMDILYQVENGRIRPSKKLIDAVTGIFKKSQEYVLLEEQRIAFDKIIEFAEKRDRKRTIIVKGGPGTGKSVISLNALVVLLDKKLNVRFVAPNSSFRTNLVETLSKNDIFNRAKLNLLLGGSGKYFDSTSNQFDTLIVDEAHRLKGAGSFMYKGKNQVEDIIKASVTNVFFVDDDQQIRPDDIGSIEEIRKYAERYNSEVYEITLEAQFRCSGADGYVKWVENTLQIRETANYDGWSNHDFEFRIMDSPHEVFDAIREKHESGYKARMLAGYAWKWTDEKKGNGNAEVNDVVISEHNFEMPWNSRKYSTGWALHPDGINQIGCIHTSQGLEFDYVGVLIGNDMKFDNENYRIYSSIENYYDSTGKAGLSKEPDKLARYIKNIYRVLLTRGMKGCYVFCRDDDLKKHLLNCMGSIARAK